MNKILRLLVVLMLGQATTSWAQLDTLFYGPDTVCVDQMLQLTSRYANQNSYYWGFCSGYLNNTPTGTNMGSSFGFHHPGNIDVALDIKTGNYYGFVVNSSTTELIRLNFGSNLNNIPTITNFGNLTQGLPVNPTSLFLVRDTSSGNWYMFVTGGFTAATSTVARIDFGPSLGNPAPNIANFGNLWGSFNYPKGIFVAQDGIDHKWYGYLINRNTNNLMRLEFSFNISNTPAVITNMGNPGGTINEATDMAAIYDYGNWYFFVTNAGTSTILRFDVGPSLDPAVIPGTDLGNFGFEVLIPSSISVNKDCGGLYAYVTDSTSNQLISIRMSTPVGPYYAEDFGTLGTTYLPTGVSSIIRDQDQLFAFICNVGDSSLTKISLQQCNKSSIPSYNQVTPPQYFYDTPGTYNVYNVINEGMPNVQVFCRTITVLPKPTAIISPDVTKCQNDVVKLWAITSGFDSIRWTNIYDADTTYLRQDSMRVWPDFTNQYPVNLYYPHGCIVKDTVTVNVVQISADAGPDRTIVDGAYTTLGGPNSSSNGLISYYWQPYQYMNSGDTLMPNPTVNPPNDYTYWLTVTELNDGLACTAHDTVVVHVVCGDFVLPNAFSPSSSFSGVNRFGILNNQISHLNYFRIFDRWGVLVFETVDPTQRWDGTYNGQLATEGVYVWEADGFCDDGLHVNKKGNVTLLR